ncbi:MAG: hypothetical protein AB7O96_05750 [Pseudobdellovibrionaceae bacterium]
MKPANLLQIMTLALVAFPTMGLSATPQSKLDIVKTETFVNQNCAPTDSCGLQAFDIEISVSRTTDAFGVISQGSNMVSSYQTQTLSQLEDYAIVQFIRGCSYGSQMAEGKVEKFLNVRRDFFGLQNDYTFLHPNWVIDSVDLDPVYASTPTGRHASYMNVKPRIPAISSDYWRKDFYWIQDPASPRLYVFDSPTPASIDPNTDRLNRVATNVSMGFKTCIFRSKDVPPRVSPTWDGDGKALHCFEWTNSHAVDLASEKINSSGGLDPICLRERAENEEKQQDLNISQDINKPLSPDFSIKGSRPNFFWQPQISVTRMDEVSIDARGAISEKIFRPLKSVSYRPVYNNTRGLVKKISLNFVVEEGTAWDKPGMMAEQLRKVSEVFSQCGVEIQAANVYRAQFRPEAQKMLRAGSLNSGPPPSVEMMKYISMERPIGILFGDENRETILATTRSMVDKLPSWAPQVDTVWLNQRAVKHFGEQAWKQNYTALAHELAHVLGNLDHTYTKDSNLMSSTFDQGIGKSGDLTPGQCEAIRAF